MSKLTFYYWRFHFISSKYADTKYYSYIFIVIDLYSNSFHYFYFFNIFLNMFDADK